MKKVFWLLVAIGAILVAGYYSVSSKADNQNVPTSTVFYLLLPQTPTAESITCTVTAFESLNLRAQPGTSAAVISVLRHGEVVTILPRPTQGNWIPVTAGRLNGWINSNFCKGQ